jgi:hypothetical protein
MENHALKCPTKKRALLKSSLSERVPSGYALRVSQPYRDIPVGGNPLSRAKMMREIAPQKDGTTLFNNAKCTKTFLYYHSLEV